MVTECAWAEEPYDVQEASASDSSVLGSYLNHRSFVVLPTGRHGAGWASGSPNNGIVIRPTNEDGNSTWAGFETKEINTTRVMLEISCQP